MACEHQEILRFLKNCKAILPICQYISFFNDNSQTIIFHFFQCGPRDFSSSLMRPLSQFEFETPDLDVISILQTLLMMIQKHFPHI